MELRELGGTKEFTLFSRVFYQKIPVDCLRRIFQWIKKPPLTWGLLLDIHQCN